MALKYGEYLTRWTGSMNEAHGFLQHDIPSLFGTGPSRIDGNAPWAFDPQNLLQNERGLDCFRKVASMRRCHA